MRKFYIMTIVAFTALIYPYAAKADFEALQPIQEKLSNLQLKAKEAQEKLMEYKKQAELAATQAKDMQSQLEQGMAQVEKAKDGDLSELATVDPKMMDSLKSKSGGDTKGAMKDTEKVAESVEENVVPKTDGGDTIEKDEEAKEFIQEMMRDAVATLYAVGFTTRTKMMKEEPHDVDMEAEDQILTEINLKAQECISRIAQIYSLESLQKTFQMIGEMQSVVYESEDEEEE